MDNIRLAGIAILLVIVGVIGFMVLGSDSDDQASQTDNNSQQSTQQPAQADNPDSRLNPAFTVAEVTTHNSADDCWTIINYKVYDITTYVKRHPGGEEILRACGQDGTSLFENRQTSDGQIVGSGTPHSDMATVVLESYLIGDLSQ